MKIKSTITPKLLKSKRYELKISQSKLSKDVGIGIQQYSNIERGIHTLPPARVKKICAKLGISAKEITEAMSEDYYNSLMSELLKD